MLTVIEYSHSNNGTYWKCLCECGNIVIRSGGNLMAALQAGFISNCGCTSRAVTHGLTDHPLHRIWEEMKKRCYNPNRKEYKNYGGRGIIICDRWLDFQNFYDDLINKYNNFLQIFPNERISIERENVNGNYELDNCSFIPLKLQGQNRRVNILNNIKAQEIRQKFSTGKYTHIELAEEYKVSKITIVKVLSNKLWKQ
jgi:hypothetical protein